MKPCPRCGEPEGMIRCKNCHGRTLGALERVVPVTGMCDRCGTRKVELLTNGEGRQRCRTCLGYDLSDDPFDHAAALSTLWDAVILVRDGILGRREFATRDRTVGEALDDALNAATRAGAGS